MRTNPNEPPSFYDDLFEDDDEDNDDEDNNEGDDDGYVPDLSRMLGGMIRPRTLESQITLVSKSLSIFVTEWEGLENDTRYEHIDLVLGNVTEILLMTEDNRESFAEYATNTALQLAFQHFDHRNPRRDVRDRALATSQQWQDGHDRTLFAAMVRSRHVLCAEQAMKVFCVLAMEGEQHATRAVQVLGETPLHFSPGETNTTTLLELLIEFATIMQRYVPEVQDRVTLVNVCAMRGRQVSFAISILVNFTMSHGCWFRSFVTVTTARVIEMFVDRTLRFEDSGQSNNQHVVPRFRRAFEFFGNELYLLHLMLHKIKTSFQLNMEYKQEMTRIGDKIDMFILQISEESRQYYIRQDGPLLERAYV